MDFYSLIQRIITMLATWQIISIDFAVVAKCVSGRTLPEPARISYPQSLRSLDRRRNTYEY